MNNAWRAQVIVAIVSAFVVAGCSSTQPDRIEARNASLRFESKASADLFVCYELPYVQCFPVLENGIPKTADRSVPWSYSLEITVIRAGTTEEVVVTSVTGKVGSSIQPHPPELDPIADFVSLTDYDSDMPIAPDRIEGGITFSNGHTVSSGSPIYLATISVFPGTPNILETTPTFDFSLNTGDTVIVRARKQGVATAPQISPPYTNIRIEAFLAISGVLVTAQGDQKSTADDKAGFTFSFTVR